jgi:hypothetical protein
MAEPAVKEAVIDPSPTKAKQERVRSTIDFPYNSLDDAIALVKAVHKLGGNQCRLESLAAELGHDTVNSGGFRQKVSSAKTFGLSSLSQGEVTLTPLGARIVDSFQEKAARVDAFLNVPLYKAIYEEFKTGTLPPISGLEAKIVSLGVPEKQKDKARQVFQRSAKEAGFFAYGTTKLVYPALGNANGSIPKPKEEEGKQPEPKPRGGGGGGDDLHPFIKGLLDKLPQADTAWAIEGRKKWLQTAANIFDLMYTAVPDDAGELTITVDKNSAK